MDKLVSLRIKLLSPPNGVMFCLQKGKCEPVDAVTSSGKDLAFSLSFRVKENVKTNAPNFLGDFAQGTPDKRFFYVGVGQRAGQQDTSWDRRVKIHLSSITWEQINQVSGDPGKVLAASYKATATDGSPACASVPLIGDGWVVSQQ